MSWIDWFRGRLRGKVGIRDTFVRGFVLDRRLELSNKEDEDYLFEVLKKRGEPTKKLDVAKEALSFISQNLDEEWLTVDPPDIVSIKIGQDSTDGLDLFSELIPLGDALVNLSELEGFEKIIAKLRKPSYQRLSTILEVMSAARYKKRGYQVELEPPVGDGSCDFRVLKWGEWIYFECKRENVQGSKYSIKMNNYTIRLMSDIGSRAEAELGSSYRVDVEILRKPRKEIETEEVIERIVEMAKNKELNEWKELNGIRFAIRNRRKESSGALLVDLLEGGRTAILCPPLGKKALQKARDTLNDAKKQTPTDSRSIIIFETDDCSRLIKMVEEKLKTESYRNIIGVILTGGGPQFVPNPLHKNFPVDFIDIAILG